MNPTFERFMSEATRLAQNASQKAIAAASRLNEEGGTNPNPLHSLHLLASAQKPGANPLNASFQTSMAEATRLMQGGNLQAATAAIQAALAGAAIPVSPTADDLNVIDVRRMKSAAKRPPGRSPAPRSSPARQASSSAAATPKEQPAAVNTSSSFRRHPSPSHCRWW